MSNNDPFKASKRKFLDLLNLAKKDPKYRISALLDASKLKSANNHLESKEYSSMLDEVAYSHVMRRLNTIVEVIRDHIHKKEYDLASNYLMDMVMLGDFVKNKKLDFDFEFYDKILRFFDKKRKDFSKNLTDYHN